MTLRKRIALTAIGAVPTALALRIDTGEGLTDAADSANVTVVVAVREIEFEEIDEAMTVVVDAQPVEDAVDKLATLASKNLETEVIAITEVPGEAEDKEEERGV